MRKYVVLGAALLALASCAEPFSAKVSRFQALPPPAGQTFVVEASDPALRGGLEFAQYAQLVSARMVEKGYQPAAPGTQPDLVVKMAYMVDHGHERVESTPEFGPSFGFGGYYGRGFGRYGYGGYYGGFGYSPFVYGFHDPFLYGGYERIDTYTVYNSELDLQIDRASSGERVFEGTAKAVSADDSLPHLVPNLVTAMFTGFPGNSGETVKITITPPPKSKP